MMPNFMWDIVKRHSRIQACEVFKYSLPQADSLANIDISEVVCTSCVFGDAWKGQLVVVQESLNQV